MTALFLGMEYENNPRGAIWWAEPASLPRSTPASRVLLAVARAFDVEVDDMLGRRRHAKLVRARAAAAWILRRFCRLTYPAIGDAMGRDHTMALFWVRKAVKLVDDPYFNRALLEAVESLAETGAAT